jgi:hypothetical protein
MIRTWTTARACSRRRGQRAALSEARLPRRLPEQVPPRHCQPGHRPPGQRRRSRAEPRPKPLRRQRPLPGVPKRPPRRVERRKRAEPERALGNLRRSGRLQSGQPPVERLARPAAAARNVSLSGSPARRAGLESAGPFGFSDRRGRWSSPLRPVFQPRAGFR